MEGGVGVCGGDQRSCGISEPCKYTCLDYSDYGLKYRMMIIIVCDRIN